MSSSRMGGDEEGNIDLNLSLSLNGRFGVDPNKRSSATLNEYGAELKMWPSIPTGTEVKEMGMGRKEEQSLALLNPNKRRSLDTQGSSTISYFQNQTTEGQGLPANNIGCSTDKNQAGKSVETGAKNVSSEALADQVEGTVFNNTPRVFISIHGQKIAGFLSKYNEEEVNIICACHGYSMTPAEFIKHAGGGDVANPERHIIISHAPGGGGDDGVNPLN